MDRDSEYVDSDDHRPCSRRVSHPPHGNPLRQRLATKGTKSTKQKGIGPLLCASCAFCGSTKVLVDNASYASGSAKNACGRQRLARASLLKSMQRLTAVATCSESEM